MRKPSDSVWSACNSVHKVDLVAAASEAECQWAVAASEEATSVAVASKNHNYKND